MRNFINVLQWRAEGHIDDAECAMLTEVYVKKSRRGEFVGEGDAGEDDEGFSLSPSRKRRSPKRSPGKGGGSSSFSPRKNKVVSLKTSREIFYSIGLTETDLDIFLAIIINEHNKRLLSQR